MILGSTGSIGTQTLDVVRAMPGFFEVLAMTSGGHHMELFAQQVEEFKPKYTGIADQECLPDGIKCEAGEHVNAAFAGLPEADLVVIALTGIAALEPLLCALRAGKKVALANKESVVCGGAFLQEALRTPGAELIPVDSEHSAIFQCLKSGKADEVERLILTASGGPFWQLSRKDLEYVTPQEALKHPIWQMGEKITVDSATMFNKGLEIIEAHFLFSMPKERIDVMIHPQSIVHSMVEYKDGAVIAQMSMPDMRLAIQYALTYPMRTPRVAPRLSLTDCAPLEFHRVDRETFGAIELAYQALDEARVLPIVYNAANEAAVRLFMDGKIGFCDIERSVRAVMQRMRGTNAPNSLEDILQVHSMAQAMTLEQTGAGK